ncbi:MAG: sugar ABC transporter permease [Candidatus Atribacteria bacterium]|nr:sugar ABC transporter permease [Candidatus Atribacteria bacterium]
MRIQRTTQEDRRFIIWSILPSLLAVVLVGGVPVLYTFVLSLKDYQLIKPPGIFIGLGNYIDLLTNNPRYIHALVFTIVFAAVAVVIEIVIGFFVAYVLADEEVNSKFSSFIRTLILIPFVIAPVVVSYTYKTLIYDVTFGYLNYFLKLFHLPFFDISQGMYNAPIGILIMEVILRTPFVTLILYAGISSIDSSIFDAGAIDGVSWWRRMFLLTLPNIKPIIVVAFAFRFMDALKMFDEIYVVTGGGPGYITENASIFAVRYGFEYFRMGYAAASSFIFLLVVLILILSFLKWSKFERGVEG